MKMLTALKFWIEDKIRMNEPHVAGQFTCQVMTEYVSLYTAFVANKIENAEFVNGPQLDKDDCTLNDIRLKLMVVAHG